MSTIRPVNESGEVVTEQPESKDLNHTEKNVSAPVVPELMEKAVAQAMGIETDSEQHQYQDKLKTLLEWAKQNTKDHSPEGLKWAIRQLELKLGTPPFAEKRVSWVARYAYLQMENKKIQSEMDQIAQGH